MAVAFRSESHAAEGAGGSSNITIGAEPAGAANGDFFLGVVYWEGVTLSTPPSGWTALFTGAYPSGVTIFNVWIGYIFRGGSAPSLTWGMSGTPTWQAANALAFTGVDTTLPVNGLQAAWGPATGTAVDPPLWWPEAPDSFLLSCVLNQPGFAATSPTPSTGYSLIATSGATYPDIAVASKQAAGFQQAENPSAWSALISSGPSFFTGMALTPSGGVRRAFDQSGPMDTIFTPSLVVPNAS